MALLGQDREGGRAPSLVGVDRLGDPRAGLEISPALGERRLNSAISESPGRTSASLNGRAPSRVPSLGTQGLEWDLLLAAA